MRKRPAGPRRSASVESRLRETRIAAMIALAVLIAGIVSDETNGRFWAHHSLLTSLVASVIVVLLTVAVFNETIERQRRRRWSVLAQYIMFELAGTARMVWIGILDAVGLFPPEMHHPSAVEEGSAIVQNTPQLVSALRGAMGDPQRRGLIQERFSTFAEHAVDVLGTWATVMLGADAYAEVFDRHMELAGDIDWLNSLMDVVLPTDDLDIRRLARASAALQPRANTAGQRESDYTPDWIADRIVVTAQLAERLDRGTLEIAMRIVPVEWWDQRLDLSS